MFCNFSRFYGIWLGNKVARAQCSNFPRGPTTTSILVTSSSIQKLLWPGLFKTPGRWTARISNSYVAAKKQTSRRQELSKAFRHRPEFSAVTATLLSQMLFTRRPLQRSDIFTQQNFHIFCNNKDVFVFPQDSACIGVSRLNSKSNWLVQLDGDY